MTNILWRSNVCERDKLSPTKSAVNSPVSGGDINIINNGHAFAHAMGKHNIHPKTVCAFFFVSFDRSSTRPTEYLHNFCWFRRFSCFVQCTATWHGLNGTTETYTPCAGAVRIRKQIVTLIFSSSWSNYCQHLLMRCYRRYVFNEYRQQPSKQFLFRSNDVTLHTILLALAKRILLFFTRSNKSHSVSLFFSLALI